MPTLVQQILADQESGLNLQGFANAVAYGLTDRHRALLVDWLCPRRADRAAPDVGVDIADKDEEGGALAPSC